ncbi:MAG TPA: hypothetical protein VHL99_05230 [Candidatus Binatia bacterium]|nr:hypothetical protein [Candidatus Binatia bacterium]
MPQAPRSTAARMGFPNSPSLGISTPASLCRRTTSPIAELRRAASAASSSAVASFFAHSARKSAGRGRLPTWVVRMRSVLRFMVPEILSAEIGVKPEDIPIVEGGLQV